MEQIFLEPNEEITSVIDKLASASGGKVAVVVPKNSTLFQSLVNLKLLAKQAKELNREVVLVTGNKVGQRLATQVGIETYATLGTVRETAPVPPPPQKAVEASVVPETLPDGTPVRRYVPATGQPHVVTPPAASEPTLPSTQPLPDQLQAEEAVASDESPTLTVASPAEHRETTEITVADEPAAPPPPIVAAPVAELPTIVSRGPIQQRREFHFELPWKSLIAAGVLLLIAFVITYVLLPKATITVTLPAKAVSEQLEVAVRSAGGSEGASVQGNLLSVDKSLTKPIAATGKKDIGTKASGTVAFKNCEDTQSRTIPAGSKVTASSKTFTSNAAVTIPAGSFSAGGTVCSSTAVNVSVTAEAAGEAYNVSNGAFTIVGQSSRISGSGSTTGGTTKQVTVLTQQDIDTGLADLDAQATTEATAELTAKAEGQTIIEGGITLTPKTRSSDKKVGDQVDSATVTLVTTASALVFEKSLVEAKIQESLAAKIDEGQRLEIPTDKPVVIAFKEYSADKSTMILTAAGSGFGVPDVSKSELAQAVKHSTRASAEQRLKSDYQATEVKVVLSPSWWMDRLPILASAITVEYGFSEVTPTQEVPAP